MFQKFLINYLDLFKRSKSFWEKKKKKKWFLAYESEFRIKLIKFEHFLINSNNLSFLSYKNVPKLYEQKRFACITATKLICNEMFL